jgi:hypothetical protein
MKIERTWFAATLARPQAVSAELEACCTRREAPESP